MSLYALQAIRMLSVPPEVTWTQRQRVVEMLWIHPSSAYTICELMITYYATGVWSTVEKCASHSDNLCLHLSYARKDVWVEWVAPCKISIYLGTKEKTLIYYSILRE